MSRRKGRETALQMLFQRDLSGMKDEESRRIFWQCNKVSAEAKKFADDLYRNVIRNIGDLDRLISGHSTNWKIERMSAVDRNTLRMALAEYLYVGSPRAVVTDEAVQIAKRFGSEKSGAFVNGILDAVLQELERSKS